MPPSRTAPNDVVRVCMLPTHSSTASTPWPPVSFRTSSTPSSPGARTMSVAGLRREEVALLAGVSVPYYTRLERGDARGATDAVLDAISRALRLDDAERAHLFDLVRAANATAAAAQATRRPARQPVRPELRNMLEAMSGVPAYVRNGRLDILAGNALARALFAPIFTSPARPVNAA